MAAGVYLHIPFCKSRCSYCDFATDVYRSAAGVERYVEALASEIQNSKVENQDPVETVYFGGGTPSLLVPRQVEKIITAVRERFDVISDAEITMEMNPATVTAGTLSAYRELGVNRASFGVQTFDDRALRLLARGHDANDARETFRLLREAGFANISFDLIAGLPGQTLHDWERNLEEAIAMPPDHISLYLLEVHEGTPLAEQIRSKRQPEPDDVLAAEMYELMLERLAATGYEQYEISNFAMPGFEARHNSKYWTLDPVYGFGVSAHSFDGRERYANERDTAKYVSAIESSGSAEVMRENTDAASEYVFLGLRLEKGVVLEVYRERFQRNLLDQYGTEVDELRNAGLIEIADGRMKLTRKGKLFSNEVFQVFI
ncbi:MAG: radical SAM family heme chaperone HemW [Acidobacteria bacterium]|nr:radical SAM family heme chaperone HemW [Acidobacteriota bacterium]